jgi:sporulation protein YlmC with PRC-barrel domain
LYARHGANNTMEEDMLGRRLALALLGTTLISAPAMAQTNQPAGSKPTPSAGDSSFGAHEPARTHSWLAQEQPGQWRASKLEGLDVYNQNNEKIGDISEMLVDSSGRIQAVVVGVGGFLGIGERDVAIPFDQVTFVNEPRAVATAATTTDPNAPAPPRATAAAPGAASPTAPTTTGTVATDRPADTAARATPDHAMLTTNMTKDQLKAAPEFKYAR